jgi:trans-L-3-hydroxyproline dehydratase
VIRRIKTIDAHAAGEPLRLVVEGFPSPQGRTMAEKRDWVRRTQDGLRRALLLEPRGHADMYGALLTEPTSPGSHAGVLFMHNDGYSTMCGHGVIAVTTIALERSLLVPGGDGRSIVYDTPAGVVRVTADVGGDRVSRVSFQNVPSFVVHGGLEVKAGARQVRADVAFGGAFYAIVDSEAVGVQLDAAHLPELRRAGMEVKRAVEQTHRIAHPLEPEVEGIYGTIFTGPPENPQADLRNVTVFADAQVDRSPCGTGTAAVMAVIDAMGLLTSDRPFVHESLIGTLFSGTVIGRTAVGDYPAIVPAISGSAWVTGDHTFWIDDADPLKDGFRM